MGSIIQFENSGLNVSLVLGERFRRQKICVTEEFDTPLGTLFVSELAWLNGWLRKGPAVTYNVSRREPFNSDPIPDYLPGHKVEFVQALQVKLSSAAQLRASGPSEPEVMQTIELHLIFDLRINSTSDDVNLIISYVDIEGLPDLPSLQILNQKIADLFPFQKLPLDIGKISGISGKPNVANAGIVVIANPGNTSASNPIQLVGQSIVAIRVELGPYPTSTDSWATFFAGDSLFIQTGRNNLTPGIQSWAIFIDETFVTESVRQGVEKSLTESGKFKLQGGIAASWSAPDNRAIINLDFFGTAVNVCDLGIFGSYDVDVRVNVPVELSVPPPNNVLPPVYNPGSMQQNVKINYWKSDWDTGMCVLGATLIWPYLGAKLMDEGTLDWYLFLGSLAIGPFVAIFILWKANEGGKLPPPGPTCVQPDSHKDEYVCSKPFDAGSIATGGLPELVDFLGLPDGLLLIGSMFWAERLGREFHLGSFDIRPFELESLHFSCSGIGPAGLGAVSERPEDFVTYTSTVNVNFELNDSSSGPTLPPFISTSKRDLIPSYICSAWVRPEDDPLNIFAPHVTFDDSSPYVANIQVRVPVSMVPAAYFSAPYPCQLLIHTSAGTRMITLPAITQATAEKIKSLALNAWAHRVSECYAKSTRYDPKWSIDPSDFYRERQFWDVIVAGLRPGEQVSLNDQSGRVISAIRASRQGTGRLRAFLSPDAYNGQLSFRRGASPAPVRLLHARGHESGLGSHALENYVRIDVKQTQFLQLSEIETDEPVLGLAPIVLGARSGLVIVKTSGIITYDVAWAQQPTVVLRLALSGLSGALSMGTQILVWGEEGIFALEIDPKMGEITLDHLSKEPVLAMTSMGRWAFILRRDRMEVWNRDYHCEAIFETPQARFLAATSTHLLVGSDTSVKIYQMSPQHCLKPIGEYHVEGLSRIVASELIGQDYQFLLEGSLRSELIDVSNPEHIMTVGEYHTLPELGLVMRHRDLLIEQDKNSMFLRIYSIGATAFI